MKINISETKKGELISEMRKLKISEKRARKMLEIYFSSGGIFKAADRWPSEFSFFLDRRNVIDILIEHKLV